MLLNTFIKIYKGEWIDETSDISLGSSEPINVFSIDWVLCTELTKYDFFIFSIRATNYCTWTSLSGIRKVIEDFHESFIINK